ncbi:hypothetical protein EEB14_45930, partial [Rhodococcus sp. WS4]
SPPKHYIYYCTERVRAQPQNRANPLIRATKAPSHPAVCRESWTPDHYFWTEAFGMQIKICGRIPDNVTPFIVEHDEETGSYLLRWSTVDGRPVAAATVNRKMPVAKLRRLATEAA